MTEFAQGRGETVRLLEAAIGLLERQGWTKGAGQFDDGPRCLLVAVSFAQCAAGEQPWVRDRACLALSAAVRQQAGARNVIEWNDTRCGSLGEAVQMLRFAIKLTA